MLWMSLVFPQLALESVPGLVENPQPWALTAEGRVFACNAAASRHGIQAGHGLSAALALAPMLQHCRHDPGRDQAVLEALAEWALGLSAEVVLEFPFALSLEIGGSLRYFGGLSSILARVETGLGKRQHQFNLAVAPTPLAALWLARSGTRGREPALQVVLDKAGLRPVLATLPVSVMDLPSDVLIRLQGVGLDTIGDCLSMPNTALSRRYGEGLSLQLAKALGQIPDPRLGYQPPEIFCREVDLQAPVQEISWCLPVLDRLLPDVMHWAARQARVVTRVRITLKHELHAPTLQEVGFAGAAQLEHLQWVLHEHLEKLQVPCPIVGLGVQILDSVVLDQPVADLLPGAPVRLREGQQLLERLRARLGPNTVLGLGLCDDHRPERSWTYREPGSGEPVRHRKSFGRGGAWMALPDAGTGVRNGPRGHGVAGDSGQATQKHDQPRPLWLLETVRDLGNHTLPCLRRPLRLLSGPERIESGWWDGSDVARDYYIAADQDGPQYWVYRNCRGEGRWFLQGIFA